MRRLEARLLLCCSNCCHDVGRGWCVWLLLHLIYLDMSSWLTVVVTGFNVSREVVMMMMMMMTMMMVMMMMMMRMRRVTFVKFVKGVLVVIMIMMKVVMMLMR